MRMKFAVALIILTALAANTLPGVNFDDRNGNWWNTRSKMEKAIYTLGMMDGVYTGGAILIKSGAQAVNGFNSDVERLFGKTNAAQLIDGMDRFYRDFRDRGIGTSQALWLVGWQISGATDAQLQPYIIALRRTAALTP
jgi:hypothetical protein